MPHTELIEERLRFLNIDGIVIERLRTAKKILEPEIDEMLERFYAQILAEPTLRALFADEDAMHRARSAQKSHWLQTLFEGKYDEAYFEKAAQIGRAHARVGLTPNWYIGAYCQMLGQFTDLISKKCGEAGEPAIDIIQAVSKIVFLDMDLVIHCYLDAKDGSMRQILHRATDFTADVKELSGSLNASAMQISSAADALSSATEAQRGTASNSDVAVRIDELRAQAQQLSAQTALLDARLEELQFKDRLFIDDDTQKSGTMARLKTLILGKQ